VVLCLAGGLLVGGCAAGVDLAVIGAASQAAGSGSAMFSAGKLKAVGMVDIESVRTAVLIAAEDLSLTVEKESSSRPGRRRMVLRDDRMTRLWVHLEQRTPTLTRMTVSVGLFGSEPTGRLLLKRIGIAIGVHFSDEKAGSGFDAPAADSPKGMSD
jgi:hypothetical protein